MSLKFNSRKTKNSREESSLILAGNTQDLTLPEIIKSEVNFLIFPFFALTPYGLEKRTKIEYRETILRDGKQLDIFWQVSSNQEFGYPGPFDREVHKAIETIISEILQETGLANNPIPLGSMSSVCKRMGLEKWGGKEYKLIKQAFERIVATTVKSEGTFFSKGKKQWVSQTFHLYDTFIAKGEKLRDGKVADTNYIYLNDLYLQSLNSYYIKPVNYKYLKSLKTNIASRLYEILGVRFYGLKDSKYVKFNYLILCQLLPIEPQKELRLAKQIFKRPHQELTVTSFLEKTEWEKKTKTDWFIYYYPGPRAIEEIQQYQRQSQGNLEHLSGENSDKINSNRDVIPKLSLSEVEQNTLKRLILFGITEKVAIELIQNLDPKYIDEWLEVMPYIQDVEDKTAYLAKALKEKWIISPPLRKARRREEQKKIQERQKEEEENRRNQKELQEKSELEELYGSLSEDCRQKIDFLIEKRFKTFPSLSRDPASPIYQSLKERAKYETLRDFRQNPNIVYDS